MSGAEVLASASIAANVIQLVGYASTITDRLKSNFSRVERVPRRVEGIATKLPQLAEAAKQALTYADDEFTTEKEQWELLEKLKPCNDLLQELAKIVPKAFNSLDAETLSQKLVSSLERDEQVNRITGRLEVQLRSLQSYARRRALETGTAEAIQPNDVPDFEAIEKEFEAQLNVVMKMDKSPAHWSATTRERYDLDYKDLAPFIQRQVDKPEGLLGTGRYGTVRKIKLSLHGIVIPLAKKTIRTLPRDIARIKEEIMIAQKLEGRPHVVRTIGAYKKTYEDGEDLFNILIFPVADCDLEQFLHWCDELSTANAPIVTEKWRQLMRAGALNLTQEQQLGPAGVPQPVQRFLRSCLGCMTQAISWMHGTRIAHHDLKPANVLLRNGRLYVTDFGLCKDRSKEQRSWTEQAGLGTKGWQAREIIEEAEQSPFRADVFSLGCIFMHIVSVIYLGRPRSKCSAILESGCSVREALIEDYFQSPRDGHENNIFWRGERRAPEHLQELILFMLKDDRYDRPQILDVNYWLSANGGISLAYHGACCHRTRQCGGLYTPSPLWSARVQHLLENDLDAQKTLVKDIEASSLEWSWTGRRFDVKYNDLDPEVRRQLDFTHGFLGAGAMATVRKILLHGIPLVKRTFPLRTSDGQEVKSETNALRKIQDHHHVVSFVGSYHQAFNDGERTFNMLIHPVADCDLGIFLERCEDLWGPCPSMNLSDESRIDAKLALAIATGISPDILVGRGEQNKKMPSQVLAFLMRLMGCMAQTIEKIHFQKISHGDLKTRNFLLRRGRLFVTDFGLSRDRTDQEEDTELHLGMTRGYAAPEVEQWDRYSPFRSDIYTLGCTYLHMVTIMYGGSKSQCVEVLTSIHHEREMLIHDHLLELVADPSAMEGGREGSPRLSQQLANLVQYMLQNSYSLRPDITTVNRSLRELGGEESTYHHECCVASGDPVEDEYPVDMNNNKLDERREDTIEYVPLPQEYGPLEPRATAHIAGYPRADKFTGHHRHDYPRIRDEIWGTSKKEAAEPWDAEFEESLRCPSTTTSDEGDEVIEAPAGRRRSV